VLFGSIMAAAYAHAGKPLSDSIASPYPLYSIKQTLETRGADSLTGGPVFATDASI
jgi:hypothetical protein